VKKPDDDITAVAQRVLEGKGTAEDVETVSLWALAMSKWVRHLGAKEQR
jgi:hypothetical protein